MAISHELSGEIAAALFAAKERSVTELHDLKQMVFEIHSTLEQLSHSGRATEARKNRESTPSANPPGMSRSAGTGS